MTSRWSMAALCGLLLATPGCAYLRDRGNDALDILDLGVTWSKKPYLTVYGCAVGLASAGAGHFEGTFAGIGGGRLGVTGHYHRVLGLGLWSYEELGWDGYDKAKPETLYIQHPGIIGWVAFLPRKPAYAPGCLHLLHLGYAGLVANLRYWELLDFILGWTTLDVACDDGEKPGKWPWQKDGARNLPKRLELPY